MALQTQQGVFIATIGFAFAHQQPDKMVHDVRLIEKEIQRFFTRIWCVLYAKVKKFAKPLAACESLFKE